MPHQADPPHLARQGAQAIERVKVTDGEMSCRQLHTELGLMVKNTIDAIELPVFDPQQFAPVKVLGRLRERLLSTAVMARKHH